MLSEYIKYSKFNTAGRRSSCNPISQEKCIHGLAVFFIGENNMRLCECGCGQEIVIKPYHKWKGIPRFIRGHCPVSIKGKTWEEFFGKKKAIKMKKERSKAIKEAINTGRKKGCIPWNKGKIGVYSKTILKQMSNVKKGKPSWNKGKKCTQLSKENNPNWQGGISPLRDMIRSLVEYKQWHLDIFKKDNYTCQECGLHSEKGKQVYLEAHHNDKSFAKLFTEFLQEYNQFSPCDDKYILKKLASKWRPFWDAEGETLCKKCHKLKRRTKYE